MGEVYRARDTKLDREVALKVLPSGFTRNGGQMTLRGMLFSPKGQINRRRYWLYSLPLAIPTVAVSLMTPDSSSLLILPLAIAVFLALVPITILTIKRLHDLNRRGWWLLLLFVPYVGPIAGFLFLGCMPGTSGENYFGPDPLADAAPAPGFTII